MEEHDSRLKSMDLGRQRRAQEAFRQGRRGWSAISRPLFWEEYSGGSLWEGNPVRGLLKEPTQATSGLELGGPDGREVTVAEYKPEERAAGVWLGCPLLNFQDFGLDPAHRGAQQTFENV